MLTAHALTALASATMDRVIPYADRAAELERVDACVANDLRMLAVQIGLPLAKDAASKKYVAAMLDRLERDRIARLERRDRLELVARQLEALGGLEPKGVAAPPAEEHELAAGEQPQQQQHQACGRLTAAKLAGAGGAAIIEAASMPADPWPLRGVRFDPCLLCAAWASLGCC